MRFINNLPFLTLTLIIISPWFWVIGSNLKDPRIFGYKFSTPTTFIEEVNTLQGQAKVVGVGKPVRLLVNKYSLYFLSLINRYIESYDPKYLFFEGDLNILKTTKTQGPLYLGCLPLIAYGLYRYKDNKRGRGLYFLLLTSPLPSVFLTAQFETVARIPFLICLTIFAALGWRYLLNSHRKILVLVLLVMLFEIARFTHEFKLHYPRKLDEQSMQQLMKHQKYA